MNVFLSADIEGTCGITDWSETERSTMDDYRPFQKQMTREVKAACKGALEGGASGILLKDAHDSARNIDVTALPEEEEAEFKIVRTKRFPIKHMTVDEAILQMNLVDHTFFAFKNADADGAFSVVYRRNDGGYGLIEDDT